MGPPPDVPTARNRTVLLVDDDEAVREVAVRLLEALGCKALLASGGEEAIVLYQDRGGPIDLALIDLTMPRMGGEATLRQLHQLAPELPLVLMSGYTQDEAAAGLADLPLAGYLQKPFRLPALSELLRRVLGG